MDRGFYTDLWLEAGNIVDNVETETYRSMKMLYSKIAKTKTKEWVNGENDA